MDTVTLCVIALNEEEMIGDCLASVQALVDQIIVVDTGSTDATVDIATAAGAQIVHFPWNGDFAAARNAALPHVTSDWILVLDADERLDPHGIPSIRTAIQTQNFDCGMLRLHNANRMTASIEEVISGDARHQESIRLPRLLRRSLDLAWEGVVHETVTTWLSKGRVIGEVDADLVHYGYVPELIRSRDKDSRNLTLLERRCVLEPNNPVCRAYLARELIRVNDTSRALIEAERAWKTLCNIGTGDHMRPAAVTVATVYAFLLMSLEEYSAALDVVQHAEEWRSDHPNLHILAGTILQNMALDDEREIDFLRAAESSFRFCMDRVNETYSEELMPGACTWAAWRGLGEVLVAMGRPEEASHYFERVLNEGRDDIRSTLGLAHCLLMKKEAAKALKTVAPVMQLAKADGWTIAAHACVQLGQFEDALELYQRAHLSSRNGFIYPTRRRLLRLVEAAIEARDTFVTIGGVVAAQEHNGTPSRIDNGEKSFEAGDILRAQVCFMEAIAHELTSPVAWMNLGVVFHAIGDPVKSTRCLRTATRLGPELSETHHNLALILWDTGRTDEAVIANRKALDVDSSHDAAKQLHARMGCMGWSAPRVVVVGPSILGYTRSQAAIANYLRLVGFSVRWAQPDIVELLNGATTREKIAAFMDRAEPAVLVGSHRGEQTDEWMQEAAARAVPVLCEGADSDDLPHDAVPISGEPTKAMQGVQAFLDATNIGPSKPLRAKWEPMLSVIVPTRNRPTGLLRLLDRLGAQDLHPSLFEVIVVDDASENLASDVIGNNAYPFELSVYREAKTKGSGHARNMGLLRARAPIVVFFDDDTMPGIDNLRGHLLMQHATNEPHLITGSFELVDSDGELSMTQEAIQSVAFDLRDLRPNGPSEPEGFFACNASIPTEVARAVGGFDAENFPYPVMDDIDFGYRVEAANISIRYCPEIKCDRDHHTSVDLFLDFCFKLGYYHNRINEVHPERAPISLVYRDQVNHENFYPSLRTVAEQEALDAEEAIHELRRCEQLVGTAHQGERQKIVKQLELLARKVSVSPYCKGMVTAHSEGIEADTRANVKSSLAGELTSVIIPNLNGFPHLIGCLDSLRRTSEGPVEVIVVDNGSGDGSLEWLRTQEDIVLLEMGQNIGAPAARNRALEIAKGETIIFCDNDVVFTPHWRSIMLNHMEAWPDVGIVGPMSDYVVGDQKVGTAPTANEPLNVYAGRFTAEYRGQYQYAMRLILFCMMVRRSVIDKIGGFDQNFGQWGYEDDDFTLRAKLAGFQLRIAKDCFIRHIGSQTAQSAKLNYQNLLVRNWSVFKHKWDIESVPYGATLSLVDLLDGKTFNPSVHVESVYTGTVSVAPEKRVLLRPLPLRRGGVFDETPESHKTVEREIIAKFSPALGAN